MSAKTEATASSLDIPNALLVYTRDNGKRQVTYVPPRKEEAEKESYVVIEKYVRDARNSKPSPTIREHGFQLILHNTSLSTRDFYANPNGIIEKRYYKEMSEAVRKVCPDAVEVKPFHYMVRFVATIVVSWVIY